MGGGEGCRSDPCHGSGILLLLYVITRIGRGGAGGAGAQYLFGNLLEYMGIFGVLEFKKKDIDLTGSYNFPVQVMDALTFSQPGNLNSTFF